MWEDPNKKRLSGNQRRQHPLPAPSVTTIQTHQNAMHDMHAKIQDLRSEKKSCSLFGYFHPKGELTQCLYTLQRVLKFTRNCVTNKKN